VSAVNQKTGGYPVRCAANSCRTQYSRIILEHTKRPNETNEEPVLPYLALQLRTARPTVQCHLPSIHNLTLSVHVATNNISTNPSLNYETYVFSLRQFASREVGFADDLLLLVVHCDSAPEASWHLSGGKRVADITGLGKDVEGWESELLIGVFGYFDTRESRLKCGVQFIYGA
jgi:hypothetical protein